MMKLKSALWLSLALWSAACVFWPKPGDAVAAGKSAPGFAAENWINSKPLTIETLKGRVVLVEFWTYG